MPQTWLTSVEELDDLGEHLEKVHVIIAVVLDFVDEDELGAAGACDGSQEGTIRLQVLQRLVGYKLLLLAPLNGIHHSVPDLHRYNRKISIKQ